MILVCLVTHWGLNFSNPADQLLVDFDGFVRLWVFGPISALH